MLYLPLVCCSSDLGLLFLRRVLNQFPMNYCLTLFQDVFLKYECFYWQPILICQHSYTSILLQHFYNSMLQLNSTEIRQFPTAVRRLKIRVSGILAIQLTMLGAVIARFKMKI